MVTIPLNSARNYTEIAVPTASYRMGVNHIGYGWAVIGKYILLIDKFTV